MDLFLFSDSRYSSNSQQARVMSENWVEKNMYCPRCGNAHLEKQKNNSPVSDYKCSKCLSEYELKSSGKAFKNKIPDGAYGKMIERICANNNPDFFFMQYADSPLTVVNFTFVPKHFFSPEIIEKRNALTQNARRAGWIGCNILFSEIPEQGRIVVVSDGKIVPKHEVLSRAEHARLLDVDDIAARGWFFEVLKCITRLNAVFRLNDVYQFEAVLFKKFPQNKNIKAKIRQQLQFLRDRGFIKFLGNGVYEKVF